MLQSIAALGRRMSRGVAERWWPRCGWDAACRPILRQVLYEQVQTNGGLTKSNDFEQMKVAVRNNDIDKE
jgi:hypothetical protein